MNVSFGSMRGEHRGIQFARTRRGKALGSRPSDGEAALAACDTSAILNFKRHTYERQDQSYNALPEEYSGPP